MLRLIWIGFVQARISQRQYLLLRINILQFAGLEIQPPVIAITRLTFFVLRVAYAPRLGLTLYSSEFCSQFTYISTRSKTSPDVLPFSHNSLRDVDQNTAVRVAIADLRACSFTYASSITSPVSMFCTATGITSGELAVTFDSLEKSNCNLFPSSSC